MFSPLPRFAQLINEDKNIRVIAAAANCLMYLARGLRERFANYAPLVLETLFAKFKEKKLSVVTAIQDALDAIFPTVSLDKALDAAAAALKSKNPEEKQQTAMVGAEGSGNRVLKTKTRPSYFPPILPALSKP